LAVSCWYEEITDVDIELIIQPGTGRSYDFFIDFIDIVDSLPIISFIDIIIDEVEAA
jgi:hypothetical protein